MYIQLDEELVSHIECNASKCVPLGCGVRDTYRRKPPVFANKLLRNVQVATLVMEKPNTSYTTSETIGSSLSENMTDMCGCQEHISV